MSRALLAAVVLWAAPVRAADAPLPPAAVEVPTADPRLHAEAKDPLVDRPEVPLVDNSGYLLFKTLLVLGIVVAIIYLTLNVGARRLLRLAPASDALVQVVDRVPLEAKKTLYVLQASGEYLLVGSTESGLSLISKLEPEAVRQALAQRVQARAQAGTFLERLQALSSAPPRKPQ
jgi:flagellar protein FliO/FliZ